MPQANQTGPAKRRTNISVDAELLDIARELGLNVSAISEEALAARIRQARAEAWQAENAGAMRQRRDWIGRNGVPLARYQTWTPEG
ncbi:MAG: type II toxin-antitoxin system CcdA family antitoxin [Pseudooceanicola sp.]